MRIKTLHPIKDLGWKFYDHAFDLGKEWRASQPRYIEKELFEIFPEAKEVIPKKIKEWEEKRAEFLDIIKEKLTLDKTTDEFSQFFLREWLKVNEGQKLLEVDRQIARLKSLFPITKGRIPKERLTEEQIQQALAVPIESLVSQPLRKSGKVLVGLCPFHNERHPSFHIYSETNSCWCYGCNQGGDVINFVRLLHNYSFKEAVKYLIGK